VRAIFAQVRIRLLRSLRRNAIDLQCSGIRTHYRESRKDLKKVHQNNKIFHYQVQEQALKVVPDLCDTIDYAEVQGVLFPRVAVRAVPGIRERPPDSSP